MRSTCRAIFCRNRLQRTPGRPPNRRQGCARAHGLPNEREASMFKIILHANDGSDHAFKALELAIDLAKRDGAELHMVSVEEIPAMAEFIEEIRETHAVAARRFHGVMQRARRMA